MPATGLRMLLAARNILCAKMMPMVTFPWGSRVTGTGLAREDTRGCRGAPPCWSLIRTGDGASLHQLKTVKFQQPKHLHQARRTKTISHLASVTNLSNLPTLGGAEDRGDLPLLDLSVVNLFLSTFLLAPSLSTKTNRGLQP